MTGYREAGLNYREAGFPYRGLREYNVTPVDIQISALPIMAVGSPQPIDIDISALPLTVTPGPTGTTIGIAAFGVEVVAPTVTLGAVSRNVPTLPIQITALTLVADQTTNIAPAEFTVEVVAPTTAQTLPLAPATFTIDVIAPTVELGELAVAVPTLDVDISALQLGFDGAINILVPTLDVQISALPLEYVVLPTFEINISATPFAAVTNVGGREDQTDDLPTIDIDISALPLVSASGVGVDAVFELLGTWPANEVIDGCGCHFVVETDPCARVLTTAR